VLLRGRQPLKCTPPVHSLHSSSRPMASSSVRASVPKASLGFVKEEPHEPEFWASENCNGSADVDKDFMCPICFQTMEDAFLTSCCGHSFCYACISTHLSNRSNCPSCSRYLTADQLIPNFLLSKVGLTLPEVLELSLR